MDLFYYTTRAEINVIKITYLYNPFTHKIQNKINKIKADLKIV